MRALDRHAIRPAEPRDVDAILGLIRELAEFERLSHFVTATPEALHRHLFGERPVVEALVVDARDDGTIGVAAPIGFALFFTNFSTFLAQPGLYLEDLYVQPTHRGNGVGRALLERLAAIAVERDCGRFEWSVLDWNAGAIRFYERMGATVMSDWRICRVAGAALQQLGRSVADD